MLGGGEMMGKWNPYLQHQNLNAPSGLWCPVLETSINGSCVKFRGAVKWPWWSPSTHYHHHHHHHQHHHHHHHHHHHPHPHDINHQHIPNHIQGAMLIRIPWKPGYVKQLVEVVPKGKGRTGRRDPWRYVRTGNPGRTIVSHRTFPREPHL